jgi:hypothetical protein
VTITVTACSSAVSREESKAGETASSTPARDNPASPLGPSACVTTGSSSGSGAWRVTEPRTLCGDPIDTSAEGQEISQENLKLTEIDFSPLVETSNIGSYTSGFSTSYILPDGLGMSRSVDVTALNGHFNTQAAVKTVEEYIAEPGEVFHTMPPGPHGGILQCAQPYTYSADCVFGTDTTIVDITVLDSSEELIGANSGATAVEIRDALEVR